MPKLPAETPQDGKYAEPTRRPTLAEIGATRRAAAGRAERAYAMLDAARAAEQETQRLLRLAKVREPDPKGIRSTTSHEFLGITHRQAQSDTPDRAPHGKHTKPRRFLARGNDPLS